MSKKKVIDNETLEIVYQIYHSKQEKQKRKSSLLLSPFFSFWHWQIPYVGGQTVMSPSQTSLYLSSEVEGEE